ncbi:hypothetical protein [Pectinatus cerevisiiphilus]|uniref:hypothetical protein n=1 Tax=Pectinatus cerevisiiphilus TaxID=86956 RepID=UPI00104C9959|nr:hypothetical protein [Pectinatus cerevisiiphilus]
MILVLPLSFILPTPLGWENGPLENSQVVILLIAMLLNLYWFYKKKHLFQLTASGAFLLLAGREVNWGRCFFPIGMGPDGPIFIPMEQFPHHTMINTVIGIMLVIVLIGVIFTTPWKKIIVRRLFPVKLFIFACICTIFSLIGDSSRLFSDAQGELVEEQGELLLYFLLLHVSVYYYYFLNIDDQ